MREFLARLTNATVIFIVAGSVLLLIGTTRVVPLGNPQPSLSSPMDIIVTGFGILLEVVGIYLGIQEMFLARKSADKQIPAHLSSEITKTVANSIEAKVAEIANQVADSIKPQIDELRVVGAGKNFPYAPSLFESRITHFHAEKELIADQFTPYLLDRCKHYILSGKNVYLIIDSGTTLFSIFSRLGKQAVKEREKGGRGEWLDHLYVETNNLVGVEMLMLVGRMNPSSRYSELALNCNLLPGAPLPIYSALTGVRTNAALQLLRDQAGSDAVFIALTTGNWIRLRRSDPVCPVPLARGQGHREFKQAVVDNADEVFVITPLGKVFVNVSLTEVNLALGFSEEESDPERKPYTEVQISNQKATRVKMVSTSRRPHNVLSHHSTSVSALLFAPDVDVALANFRDCSIEAVGHLFFPFDQLPADWHLQMAMEFPHENTRKQSFVQKFFHVPQSRI